MVGFEGPVELGPGHLHHLLVVQTQVVQEHGRSALASSPAASSPASLISDSTARLWHWATSSGPRSPAASTAKAAPSTSRTPAATGSIPNRSQAKSRNEGAATTSTVTRSSSRSSTTVRSAT